MTRFCGMVLLSLLLVGCAAAAFFAHDDGPFLHVNDVDPAVLEQASEIIDAYLPNYRYISVALVLDGEVKLAGSFGMDRTGRNDVYASVSKPVTATLFLALVQAGVFASIDDPISQYSDRYHDVMPEAYADAQITFRHLLTHTSGIPHHDRIWSTGTLALEFRPGTATRYSTRGYGVLGEVMEEATGRSFDNLIKEYIGTPVEADSIRADDLFFETPGGRIWSTIGDMARFAVGIIDGVYFPESWLYEEVIREYQSDASGAIGLGWYVANTGSPNAAIYHAGSNGRPRAFIAIRPATGYAVCLMGRHSDRDGDADFYDLTVELMNLIAQ